MKIGDRVVCIKSDFNGVSEVKKGIIYSVHDTLICPCGLIHIDVGGSNEIDEGTCECGRTHNVVTSYFCSKFFAPIEYNSAHDELISKIVEEKPEFINEPAKC